MQIWQRSRAAMLGIRAVVPVLGVLLATPAAAGEVPVTTLAHGCIACHGAQGSSRDAVIPPLAGRDPAALLELLQVYRRPEAAESTSMHRLTRGYSDAELAALARYFAEQRQ